MAMTPERYHQLKTSDLVDFGEQGGMSIMKEVPGLGVMAKEIKIKTAEDLDLVMNEFGIAMKLDHLSFVEAPQTFKREGSLAGGDMKYRFYMNKIEGKPAEIPKSEERLIEFGVTISDMLLKIAQEGIVLVDLKPANILQTQDGYKIIDLGVSTFSGLKPMGVTHEYAPADATLNGNVDSRHDTYTLASMLASSILGKLPNEYYGGKAIGLDLSDMSLGFQKIAQELSSKCNNKQLACILVNALNPDRDKRQGIFQFAKQLESISPRYIAFSTIEEGDINAVKSYEDVGHFLKKLKGSLLRHNQRDREISKDGNPFLGTNFDMMGRFLKYLDLTSQLQGNFLVKQMENAYEDIENFLTYGRALYTSGNPDIEKIMKGPDGEKPNFTFTPLQKENLRILMTLRTFAKNLELNGGNKHSAVIFIQMCLKLLENPDQNIQMRYSSQLWKKIADALKQGYNKE